MSSCQHNIAMTESCPWCGRIGDKKFAFRSCKKYWQFYQVALERFLDRIRSQPIYGPLAISIVVHDSNGQSYTYIDGPISLYKGHPELLKDHVDKELKEMKDATPSS